MSGVGGITMADGGATSAIAWPAKSNALSSKPKNKPELFIFSSILQLGVSARTTSLSDCRARGLMMDFLQKQAISNFYAPAFNSDSQ